MNLVNWVQIKAICISHSTNTLEKDMHTTIFPPAIAGQAKLFNLGMATSLEEGKFWIQTCCRPGYSCPRHAICAATQQAN